MSKEQPSDAIFNDIKQASIQVWQTYDNTYGYVDEKLERINSIRNYSDNWYTFVGMFDSFNQIRMFGNLELEESALFIRSQLYNYGIVLP